MAPQRVLSGPQETTTTFGFHTPVDFKLDSRGLIRLRPLSCSDGEAKQHGTAICTQPLAQRTYSENLLAELAQRAESDHITRLTAVGPPVFCLFVPACLSCAVQVVL